MFAKTIAETAQVDNPLAGLFKNGDRFNDTPVPSDMPATVAERRAARWLCQQLNPAKEEALQRTISSSMLLAGSAKRESARDTSVVFPV